MRGLFESVGSKTPTQAVKVFRLRPSPSTLTHRSPDNCVDRTDGARQRVRILTSPAYTSALATIAAVAGTRSIVFLWSVPHITMVRNPTFRSLRLPSAPDGRAPRARPENGQSTTQPAKIKQPLESRSGGTQTERVGSADRGQSATRFPSTPLTVARRLVHPISEPGQKPTPSPSHGRRRPHQ